MYNSDEELYPPEIPYPYPEYYYEPQPKPTLDEIVDSLIKKSDDNPESRDDMQNLINDQIFLHYNSVNLVIGKRGSGKTYTTLREILKIPVELGDRNKFTQIHYITDKARDDTVEKFIPAFKKCGFYFNWVSTSNAEQLIRTLTALKGMISDPEWIAENEHDNELACEALNCSPKTKGIPHTIIIFDDCIGLFSKATSLSKLLFENRQSRITYFLILQDVQGLSPSMKANIDSLTLFGGFPKHKFLTLFYQLPPVDLDFDTYATLDSKDAVRIDYLESSVKFLIRNKRCQTNQK